MNENSLNNSNNSGENVNNENFAEFLDDMGRYLNQDTRSKPVISNNVSEDAENHRNENNENQLRNFDDIPIKSKTNNFLDLLEKNLNNPEYNAEDKVPKRIFEYKPRIKRSELLDTSNSNNQVKKYKYYSQNFDREFGKNPSKEEMEYYKKLESDNEKKNKFQKNEYSKTSTKKDIHKSNIRSNSNIPVKNKNSNIKLENTNQKNSIKETFTKNKNEFPNQSSSPIIKINSENKVNYLDEGLEIKMSNTKNFTITKPSFKVETIIRKKEDLELMKNPNPVSDDEIEREVPSNKNLTSDTKMKNINFEDYFSQGDQENVSKQEEEDEDDHRDILAMYSNYNKQSLNIVNNNPKQTTNKISNSFNETSNKTDSNLKNELSSPTLYKKPEGQKIINKYFKTPNPQQTTPPQPIITNQINKDILDDKINELNQEIEKFKKENEKVTKLKSEYERLTKKLNKEIEDFTIKKQREIEDFENYKQDEMKKIEKEKKAYLRNTKLLQSMPNRKEREEIETLKEQVLKLQDEMKSKDNRNRLAMDRMRKQLEESNKKNEDLQKEIKIMEELRIKNLQGLDSNKNQTRKSNAPKGSSFNTDKDVNNKLDLNKSNNSRSHLMKNHEFINSQSSGNLKNKVNQNLNNITPSKNKKIKQTVIVQDEDNDYKPSVKTKKNLNSSKHSNYVYSNYNSDEEKQESDSSGTDNKENSKIQKYKENEKLRSNYDRLTIKNDENSEDEIKINKIKEINKTGIKISSNKISENQYFQTESNKNNYPNNKNRTSDTNPNMESNKINKPVNLEKNDKSRRNNTNYTNQDSYNYKNTNTNTDTYGPITQNKLSNNNDEDEYEMIFLEKYHGNHVKNVRLLKQDFTEDGKIIKLYENKRKEIIFPSGVKKETFEDGYQVTFFNNKDIKQLYPDGREVYLFYENQTVQFKFPDGLHVFKFSTGQLEKHYSDGMKVLTYSDGTLTNVYPDGYQETFFPDGSLKKVDKSGVITFDYEDGMKVI